MENRFEDIVGKVILVGITHYTRRGACIKQKQLWGTVISAGQSGIVIRQKDGTSFSIPPDLSSTEPAKPGEYRLRSTGEVVVNPDYLSTWNSYEDEVPEQ